MFARISNWSTSKEGIAQTQPSHRGQSSCLLYRCRKRMSHSHEASQANQGPARGIMNISNINDNDNGNTKLSSPKPGHPTGGTRRMIRGNLRREWVCKSFVETAYRGERLIELYSSWFPPKFPSGQLESNGFIG